MRGTSPTRSTTQRNIDTTRPPASANTLKLTTSVFRRQRRHKKGALSRGARHQVRKPKWRNERAPPAQKKPNAERFFMESEGKKMPPPSRYKVMVYGSGAQSARVCEWVSTRRADFYIRIVRALRQYDFKSAKMINFHIFSSVLSPWCSQLIWLMTMMILLTSFPKWQL